MALGAVSGLVAVAMAAYASHGLEPARSSLAMTGASLQAWHALALLGTGLLAERRVGSRMPHVAGAFFAIGSLAFCTGVYLRALSDLSIGLVTPLGGTALMVGWGVLAVAAILPQTR
jgi:uncharacterized membrane protein YgdD (TMEM256/DUF423 family)